MLYVPDMYESGPSMAGSGSSDRCLTAPGETPMTRLKAWLKAASEP